MPVAVDTAFLNVGIAVSGITASVKWNHSFWWYGHFLKMEQCSVSGNSSCCHNSPNGGFPYGVHLRF